MNITEYQANKTNKIITKNVKKYKYHVSQHATRTQVCSSHIGV